MATSAINKDQMASDSKPIFAKGSTKPTNRSMTLPSANKKMSYSQISQDQAATGNDRVFAQDFTKTFSRSMTLPSTDAIVATLPINKDQLVAGCQRVFAQDFPKAVESSTPVTTTKAEQVDPQTTADQPASSGGGGKRVYSCNSVIVCMSKLDAFETDAEKSYCEKHHIAEALEEIYHTAEKEQGGAINDKDRKKYSKKFRLSQFRKSPAYGHDHEKCDCGCCQRLGGYLAKVQETLAKEEGRRLGLWTVFTLRRQFGIKLNKKGLVRGRLGEVSGSE